MSNKVENNQVLTGPGAGTVTVSIYMTSGTVQLQFLAGNDPATGNWVNVAAGFWNASAGDALSIGPQQKYRFTLTGDAQVWVAS